MFCSEWFLSLENNLIYIGNHFKLGIRFLGLGYFENEQFPVLYRFLSFSRRLTILKFCLIIFFVTFTVLLFYILSPLPFCCSTFLSFNNFEILKFCQWTFLLLHILTFTVVVTFAALSSASIRCIVFSTTAITRKACTRSFSWYLKQELTFSFTFSFTYFLIPETKIYNFIFINIYIFPDTWNKNLHLHKHLHKHLHISWYL